ncbi:hypothetical protein K501DRAFT_279272 [Backusella circina FSU 941]|nr:hypothetical protein K501DRAFT_280670 [Backusella circina FSU 941]KAI8876601.1 hypothetical protein K501DRAFT_279272 [Backusella circina FSU 941]
MCATFTKSWFREFSIDNFTRLKTCGKDLLVIRDDIFQKYSLPPSTNLNDLAIVQKLIPMTKSLHRNEIQRYNAENKTKKQRGSHDMMYTRKGNYDSDDSYGERRRNFQKEENFWAICPNTQNHPPPLISFLNESDCNDRDCNPSTSFCATLSVQPLDGNMNLKNLQKTKSSSSHKIVVSVSAQTSGGSWGGGDIWVQPFINSKALVHDIKILDIEGLSEDLLMKFIFSIDQPKLHSNGETSLVTDNNALKSNGSIRYTPKDNL